MIILSCVAVVSCQKELTKNEYQSFVVDPENGLRKDFETKDFDISVMYEPAEYLQAKMSDNEIEPVSLSDIENYEHFQFRIRLKSGSNILMYNETSSKNEVTRINHFGFTAQDDFIIVSELDTSRCKLAHYSRNYNLSPTVDLTLAFDRIEKTSDWQFIYSDQQFDLGRIKFLFKQEDLEDLPKLKK